MSQAIEPSDTPQYRLATRIVQKLVAAGHLAYFAGGCVRDGLLGRAPKDYDVATSATPEEVRTLFGHRKTLAIGASFGVISVLGDAREHEGQIDVATFRKDGLYVDGRRPEKVEYSCPELDAQRRDFTINGLFYDPLHHRVIDFVGGQQDLKARIVRAIGIAEDRFREDKLRLLRGVRFAAEYDFEIEPTTFLAIQKLGPEICVVSGERIANEMERALKGAHPDKAIQLLQETGLLDRLLPETSKLWGQNIPGQKVRWHNALPVLVEKLRGSGFAASLAGLVLPVSWGSQPVPAVLTQRIAQKYISGIASRWRVSNQVRDGAIKAIGDLSVLLTAHQKPWSCVQPCLVHAYRDNSFALAKAVCETFPNLDRTGLDFCGEKLSLTSAELNPPPLLTGNDLAGKGLIPGPQFKHWLQTIRDRQLDQLLKDPTEAKEWLDQELARSKPQNPGELEAEGSVD